MLTGGIIMNTVIGLAVVLVILFGAGVGVELHNGLKEDKKYVK